MSFLFLFDLLCVWPRPAGGGDVILLTPAGCESRSFVLPMLYNITENSDDDNDPDELVPTGVGTMRKKDVNEGKDYGVEDESRRE